MNQRCLSPISISDRNFSFLYISSVELKRGYMSDVGKDSFKNVFLMLVSIALLWYFLIIQKSDTVWLKHVK